LEIKNINKQKKVFTIFCLLLFSSPIFAQAISVDPDTSKLVDNHVADVIFVKGQVYKIKPGKKDPILIAENQRFNEGDTIQTGKASFIKLKMIDDTIISLGPYSKLHLELFKQKSKDDRSSVYGFLVGKIRAHFKNKAKPGDIIIKTKSASMGVRGTKLVASLKANKEGKIVTQFGLLQGIVRVTNNISGKKFNLNPKEEFIIFSDENENLIQEGIIKMDDNFHEELLASHLNELEDMEPLLRYYEKDSLPESRSPNSSKSNSHNKFENKNQKTKSGWKNNLKELNQRLEKYNGS